MTLQTADERVSTPMLPSADSLGGSLDELVAHLNDTVESLREVEYRATVLRLTASADNRSHVEPAIEQLALALADHRSCAATLDKLSQRVSTAYQLNSSDRNLAECARRAPDQWRAKLTKGIARLRQISDRTRQELRQAESVTRSNLCMTEAAIDDVLGPGTAATPAKPVSQVTYDATRNRPSAPRLLDGRV